MIIGVYGEGKSLIVSSIVDCYEQQHIVIGGHSIVLILTPPRSCFGTKKLVVVYGEVDPDIIWYDHAGYDVLFEGTTEIDKKFGILMVIMNSGGASFFNISGQIAEVFIRKEFGLPLEY